MISWLYILMAIYVHTCTEYVQYRICLTSMKDNGWKYRTFCSGKKCPTVRRRSANVRLSIVSISGRSRSERPTVRHNPGQIIPPWENKEFRSYIIYIILQGPQISYHIRAKWTRVSPVWQTRFWRFGSSGRVDVLSVDTVDSNYCV